MIQPPEESDWVFELRACHLSSVPIAYFVRGWWQFIAVFQPGETRLFRGLDR